MISTYILSNQRSPCLPGHMPAYDPSSYTFLQKIKKDAELVSMKVTVIGDLVFVHPEHIEIHKPGNIKLYPAKTWLMEIPNHCVC